jgi:hypothetical protein
MKRAATLTILRGRFGGEVVVRSDCNCGLCRRYREEPNTVIRTFEENRARGGGFVSTLEQYGRTDLFTGPSA